MAKVVLEHLTKTFPSSGSGAPARAVDDLSLEVQDGELLVMVGPSGCGKSTTLRLIAGLEASSQGSIRIGDRVVDSLAPREREIAMVFQNPALYPHLTVEDNLSLGLELRKISSAEVRRRVSDAAEMLGIVPLLQRLPQELSGGQQQRVAVGRALVRQPKVLLLDEPLSDLDAPSRQQLRWELASWHQKVPTTMIYVTHDQSEAMTLGQRVAVLKEGRLQQLSDPIELYENPGNTFVAEFIGSPPMNLFPGMLEVTAGRAQFVHRASSDMPESWSFPAPPHLPPNRPLIAGLRPEHFHLLPSATTVEIEGRVEFVERLGPETLLHLGRGAHRFIARLPGTQRLPVGSGVRLHAEVGGCRFFDPASGSAVTEPVLYSRPL